MTQRSIEIVIGRLLTDEEFREDFVKDPQKALRDLIDRGTHLTQSEMAALLSIDAELWLSGADRIDPRLQKASLRAAPVDAEPADRGRELDES